MLATILNVYIEKSRSYEERLFSLEIMLFLLLDFLVY